MKVLVGAVSVLTFPKGEEVKTKNDLLAPKPLAHLQ